MRELERIERLKIALRHATQGRGVGAAVVEVFRGSHDREEREAARRILLGISVRDSVAPMTNSGEPGFDLLRYVVSEARVNSVEAGKNAEKLSRHFERWAETKQKRNLESRAMEVRAHMIAAIMGAVLAMISSLAPILASFQLVVAAVSPTTTTGPSDMAYFGFGAAVISSVFLGLFSSPRRPYVEPIICAVAYIGMFLLISPLVVFSPVPPL
jgi:hypothetical protein